MRRMLEALDPAGWETTRVLFEPLNHHLAVRALLAGTVLGKVYADEATRPAVAVAWVQQRLFLAGQPDAGGTGEALYELITSRIDPGLPAHRNPSLSLYAASSTWAEPIKVGLKALAPAVAVRHYYECLLPRPARPQRVPEGYTLRAVDRSLLEDGSLAHRGALLEEMHSERPSAEDFLTQSFGVCAVRGDALAGWCLSEYNHAGACEVGIETLPQHRGQGLAVAMTSEFIEKAAAQGMTRIGWHCYAHNQASVATALAAGFEKMAEYQAYVVDLQRLSG